MTSEQPACHKCELSLISHLFCFNCKKLQPFDDQIGLFEVMGIPIDYEINSEQLEEYYQRLSLELHPDFFEVAPKEEKRLSEKASVILNTAYNTLREPSSRAGYLLCLFTNDHKQNERSLPEGFLQEMFFLQESLDELLESSDSITLEKMKEELGTRHKEIEFSYAPLFKKFKEFPGNFNILQQLQTHLNAERYLRRLLERIPSADHILT